MNAVDICQSGCRLRFGILCGKRKRSSVSANADKKADDNYHGHDKLRVLLLALFLYANHAVMLVICVGERLKSKILLTVPTIIAGVVAVAGKLLLVLAELLRRLLSLLLDIRLLRLRLSLPARRVSRCSVRVVPVPRLVGTGMPSLVLHSTPDSSVRTNAKCSMSQAATAVRTREVIMTAELVECAGGMGMNERVIEPFASMLCVGKYKKSLGEPRLLHAGAIS